MTLRSILRDHLSGDPEISAIIPKQLWFPSGSITEENRPTPSGPFAVMRFGVATIGVSNIKRFSGELWVHDEVGSYETIDSLIASVFRRLNGVVHLQDSDGNELMSADWVSDSGDLYDPGYRTIVRTTTYNLIGQGV